MKFSTIISGFLLTATVALAAPDSIKVVKDIEGRQSGCYPFEDPDCCVDYPVCQCANGWFYEFNSDEVGCNPPWGILGTSPNSVPGYCC